MLEAIFQQGSNAYEVTFQNILLNIWNAKPAFEVEPPHVKTDSFMFCEEQYTF